MLGLGPGGIAIVLFAVALLKLGVLLWVVIGID